MSTDGELRIYLAGESSTHPEVKTWKHSVAEEIDASDVTAVDPIAAETEWLDERSLIDRAVEALAESDAVLVRSKSDGNGGDDWRAATEVREAVSQYHLPVIVWKPNLVPSATLCGNIKEIEEAFKTTRRPRVQITEEYLSPFLLAQSVAVVDDLNLAIDYIRDNPGRVTREELEEVDLVTTEITPEAIIDSDRIKVENWRDATVVRHRSDAFPTPR